MMRRQLVPALLMTIVFTVLTGLALPARRHRASRRSASTTRANGSLVKVNGKVVGSSLIGQNFTGAEVLPARARRRPATTATTALASAASNLGPTNPDLLEDRRATRVVAYRQRERAGRRRAGPGRRGDRLRLGSRPGHLGRQRPAPGGAGRAGARHCRSRRCSRAVDRAHRGPAARASSASRGSTCSSSTSTSTACRSRSTSSAHEHEASLRVYLGAAPGVGKTFAMLDEGRRRSERGTDVVVGFVETHGRPKTTAQLGGLEVDAPQARSSTAGSDFEEMDVDAILARRPEVALVDELAHTNVPGLAATRSAGRTSRSCSTPASTSSRRSTSSTSSRSTTSSSGSPACTQRETVPDEVVRARRPDRARRHEPRGAAPADGARQHLPGRADRRRARQLLPRRQPRRAARARAALGRRPGRRGPAGLPRAPRHRRAVGDAGAGASSRSPARPAATTSSAGRRGSRCGRRASWSACTCSRPTGSPAAQPDRLDAHRALARGARWPLPRGRRAPTSREALVQIAPAENATQIVLGASRRSRWAELTRGSVINDVIRQSGARLRRARDLDRVELRRRASAVAAAAAAAAARRAVAPAAGDRLRARGRRAPAPHVRALAPPRQRRAPERAALLPPPRRRGRGDRRRAAGRASRRCSASCSLNWFFAPPIHTFTIANGRDLLALVVVPRRRRR